MSTSTSFAASPVPLHGQLRVLEVDGPRAVLAAAKGEDIEALVALGLAIGASPGELIGLRWSDVDLEAELPTVTIATALKLRPDGSLVRGAPKRSRSAIRTIALPSATVVVLRAQQGRSGESELVFPARNGEPIDPANLRRAFSAYRGPGGGALVGAGHVAAHLRVLGVGCGGEHRGGRGCDRG